MSNRRIILDTNLWISFLISKKLSQIDRLIDNKEITLIFSDELIKEFIDVVSRPKFEKYFSKNDIEQILDHFDSYGILINVTSDVKICRDQKDNFLLNLSLDSNADYLITGDNDLLILKTIRQTEIKNLSELIKIV